MTQTLKKVVILSLEERGIQESTKLLEANGFEVEIRQPRKRVRILMFSIADSG